MVTITILTLALLSLNFFVVLSALLDRSIATIENKINVTVRFQPTAQETEIKALTTRIAGLPEAASVTVITREEALERLKQHYSDDSQIQESLQELGENPLSASAVIKAVNIEGYSSILTVLADKQFASIIERQSFNDRTQLIKRINDIKINITRVGTAVTIFFAIVAALIVMNTIRMTIYARRREVGVMKLVGATNWFIRAPLIIEALIYGVCAVALTVLIVFPLLSAAQPYITQAFDVGALDVLGYFSDHFFFIFGYELLAAVVLTMISSSIAIGRYLKV